MRKIGTAAIIACTALVLAGCTPDTEDTAETETTEAEMPAQEDVPATEPAETAGAERMTAEEDEVDDGERTGPDDRTPS